MNDSHRNTPCKWMGIIRSGFGRCADNKAASRDARKLGAKLGVLVAVKLRIGQKDNDFGRTTSVACSARLSTHSERDQPFRKCARERITIGAQDAALGDQA